MGRITLKFFILIILILIALTTSKNVVAQTDESSSTWRTRVGDPVATNDLRQAAVDIKNAYSFCANGYTYENSTLESCLRTSLQTVGGYPSNLLDAFESRRSIAFPDGCTQCVGYVGASLSLTSGDTNTVLVAAAKDIASSQAIRAGTDIYQKLPSGTPPQPGDIGVSTGGTFGHVLIVNEVLGNVKFTALESNAGLDCRVTDSRERNSTLYTLYRK